MSDTGAIGAPNRSRRATWTRGWIIGSAVGIAGVGVALIAFDSWRAYRRDFAEAERASRNLVIVLQAHTARTIQAVEQALAAIAERPETLAVLHEGEGSSYARSIVERVAALPQLRWLNVVDADGRVVVATTAPAASVGSAAGRAYFEMAKAPEAVGRTNFGALERGRTSDRWFIGMSRRISTPDGSFAGVVAAAVEPGYFAELYRHIDLGQRGNVTLFGTDGTIVARWPEHDAYVGRSVATGVLFREHLPAAPAGTVRLKTVLQGRQILLSYRTIDDGPFVINVAYDLDEVLASWRKSLAVYVALALGFVALTAAAAFLIDRNIQRAGTIAAVRRMAEDAMRAKAQVDAEAKAMSTFFSAMSHELRTPLNGIIGYCQMLQLGFGGGPGSRRHDEYLRNIELSGQHLLETVNDILDLAKIAEGRTELRDEVVRIGELLSECAAIARGMGAGKVRDLVVRGDALGADMRVDPLRLKQIVLNLASNAIKVSPEDQMVTLRADFAPDGGIVIAVDDRGPGMTETEVQAAIQPWSRPDVAVQRSFARTGLGLSLSKALAELHGGRLEIVSAKQRGTTVRVWLPRVRQVAPALTA